MKSAPEKLLLEFTVNGERQKVMVYPMMRLLDVLRNELQLTGTKEGCGEGECGACSVLMDGRLVNACLVPAIQAQGSSILTVEGLAERKKHQDRHGRTYQEECLHPLQEAFHVENGAQCGFCTPGMLMAAKALREGCAEPTEAQIREGLAGNLCRCTGYVKIIEAMQAAGVEKSRTDTDSPSSLEESKSVSCAGEGAPDTQVANWYKETRE